MPIRYPGEGETEQIGKMIDAGHPELAHRMWLTRFRYKLATRGLAVVVTALGSGSLLWHLWR